MRLPGITTVEIKDENCTRRALDNEVDAMAQKAQANGCLLSPARWTGDGFYEAVVAAPDGNRIELVAA